MAVITMTYLAFRPIKALEPYIESIEIHASEPSKGSEPTQILPTGTTALLFHFGDPFYQIVDGRHQREPDAYINGQRNRVMRVVAGGRTGIVMARLTPWGTSRFLGDCASIFQDQSADLTAFFDPAKLGSFLQRLRETDSDKNKAELLQAFLLNSMRNTQCDPLVLEVARSLYGAMPPRISTIAKNLHVSQRQLDRRFKRAVGLTPKRFASVVRFQKALSRLHETGDLTRLAAEVGYFDQSHMVHEFNQLAGSSPSTVRASIAKPTPLTAFYREPTNMSRFYNSLYLQ